MRGLYEAVLGRHPSQEYALQELQDRAGWSDTLMNEALARFRDAWFELTHNGYVIRVITRTGGNNRAEHADSYLLIIQHPWFLGSRDEQIDSTYASTYFLVPPHEVTVAMQKQREEPPIDFGRRITKAGQDIEALDPDGQQAARDRMDQAVVVIGSDGKKRTMSEFTDYSKNHKGPQEILAMMDLEEDVRPNATD